MPTEGVLNFLLAIGTRGAVLDSLFAKHEKVLIYTAPVMLDAIAT